MGLSKPHSNAVPERRRSGIIVSPLMDQPDPIPPRATGSRRALLLLAFLHTVLAIFFLAPAWVRPDSVAIFSWSRSALFDHDFLFFDEWRLFHMIPGTFPLFKEVTPLGTLANHWWIGTAAVTFPPYLAAHLLTLLTGRPEVGGGFFGIYAWCLAWCSVFFGFVVTAAIWHLLWRSGAGVKDASLVLAAVFFGTPLFWYELRLPLGTHLAAAAAVSLLICLLDRIVRGEHCQGTFAAAGALLGIAIAIRLQNFVLIPAVALTFYFAGARRAQWLRAIAAAIPPLALQGVAWWIVYGTPLGPLVGGGNASGVTWMPFQTISIVPVIASSFHGLLPWAPVTLLAILGWLAPPPGQRRLGIILMVVFAGELAANSLLDRYYWGGLSFGPRRFVDLAAPFAIGILWWMRGRIWKEVLALAATVWTALLALAATFGNLGLRRDPGWAGLARAAFHPLSDSSSAASLHSMIVDPSSMAEAALGLGTVLAFGIALLALNRRKWLSITAAIYFTVLSLAALALDRPTRLGGRESLVTEHLDPRMAGRLGPLLDQRSLLMDDLQSAQIHGRNPSRIASEIAAVDRAISGILPPRQESH
jgi:hypothetical protein